MPINYFAVPSVRIIKTLQPGSKAGIVVEKRKQLFRISNLVLTLVRKSGPAVLLNGVKHNKSLFAIS